MINLISKFPKDVNDREPKVVEKLIKINDLMKLVDKTFAIVLYTSLKGIAISVAKSSGGFMGVGSISEDEKKYLELPMIDDPSLLFR